MTVPTGVITTGGSVILVEVTYPYVSTVTSMLPGTTNMTSTFYARPRRSTTISRIRSFLLVFAHPHQTFLHHAGDQLAVAGEERAAVEAARAGRTG